MCNVHTQSQVTSLISKGTPTVFVSGDLSDKAVKISNPYGFVTASSHLPGAVGDQCDAPHNVRTVDVKGSEWGIAENGTLHFPNHSLRQTCFSTSGRHFLHTYSWLNWLTSLSSVPASSLRQTFTEEEVELYSKHLTLDWALGRNRLCNTACLGCSYM